MDVSNLPDFSVRFPKDENSDKPRNYTSDELKELQELDQYITDMFEDVKKELKQRKQ